MKHYSMNQKITFWIAGVIGALVIFVILFSYALNVEKYYIDMADRLDKRVYWQGGIIVAPPARFVIDEESDYKRVKIFRDDAPEDYEPEETWHRQVGGGHSTYILAKVLAFFVPIAIFIELILISFKKPQEVRTRRLVG